MEYADAMEMDRTNGGEERILRRAVVPSGHGGRRLDQAAAELLAEFSRTRLKGWIESGALTLEGRRAEPKTRVRGGEEIALDAAPDPVVPQQPEAIPLELICQDADFFIVDKPAGLVVHPGAGNRAGTLFNALLHLDEALARVPRAGIVHRLDKDTSGLLVVARTLRAHGELVRQLERREVRRVSMRRSARPCSRAAERVDAAIGRHPANRLRMAVVAAGRPALTRYRVLERFRAHTRVRVELETGTHAPDPGPFRPQARAPGWATPCTAAVRGCRKSPDPALRRTLQSFPRQALHARRLQFRHPAHGEDHGVREPLAGRSARLARGAPAGCRQPGLPARPALHGDRRGVRRMTFPDNDGLMAPGRSVNSGLNGGFIVPDWPAPARVRAASTLRGGGVSRGPYASFNLGASVGDDGEAVTRNRRVADSEILNLPAEPLWLRQVHGTTVPRPVRFAPLRSRPPHRTLAADCWIRLPRRPDLPEHSPNRLPPTGR